MYDNQTLIKIPKSMLENYASNLYEAGYYSNAINIWRMIDEQMNSLEQNKEESKDK
jgi:hypothetical protein